MKRGEWKGIWWDGKKSRWRADIYVNQTFTDVPGVKSRRLSLGTFVDKRAAALAYDEAARRYFGEFAALNFPVSTERQLTDSLISGLVPGTLFGEEEDAAVLDHGRARVYGGAVRK